MIARHPSRFDGQGGVLAAIRDAALEVERPIFFSLLIIISAYIPLFTLERVERRLFTPMAFTVCYALLGSMLLALTLIPVLATYLFRGRREELGESALAVARNRYEARAAASATQAGDRLRISGVIVLGAFLLSWCSRYRVPPQPR